MINIAEILKDCPKGTKLYCTLWGDVELVDVEPTKGITVRPDCSGYYSFNLYGHSLTDKNNSGECLLFPSKFGRDWTKFSKKILYHQFKPFDKVVVRNNACDTWNAAFFSHMDLEYRGETVYCTTENCFYNECLPYNEETGKLIGTYNNFK